MVAVVVVGAELIAKVDDSISKGTMVENGKKHRQKSNLIIYFPTSEGVSEVSGVSEWTSEWPCTAVCIFDCSRP